MRSFFLMALLGVMGIWCFNTPHREPASEPAKTYTSQEAIDKSLDALKAQPQVKEAIDNVEKQGDAILKSMEESVKDTVMEAPVAVLAMGAKIAMDKKVEIKTKAPWVNQDFKLTMKPDKVEVSLEGQVYMIEGMKYNLATDSKESVGLNLSMDF